MNINFPHTLPEIGENMILQLYLIRHGESANNITDNIGGHAVDTPLTEHGKLQAIALGKYLREQSIEFDTVYSSTAIRAMDTAKLALGNQRVITTERLLERSQGDWAGRSRSSMYTPELRGFMDEDPLNFKAPNGESQLETEQRGLAFLEDEIDYRDREGKIAIFGHGMLFKCMLHGIMQYDPRMTWRIRIENTSITKLSYDDKGWHLDYLNATAHLQTSTREKYQIKPR
jgi:broad specificity phosphatase PhoE